MEASTIPATAVLAPQQRVASAGPLLRLRSDEQLVRLFREGSEEAFRVIHDRYRSRLLAYARQMLAGSRLDAEDALQDVFVRVYGALRADDREITLRAWLYRVAHNRCIDELRRPAPPPPEELGLMRPPASDPIATTEQRESLRRLVADVRRLPEQQRSALLMREMVGLPYQDLAAALDVTVPAVKSLLVRARIGLAQAAEARDTACVAIREELAAAQERGVRASGLARRHLHDCADCRAYRGELRAAPARFAALVPALGPGALLAKLLGIGGGIGGGGASAAGGGAAAGAGVAAGGGALSAVGVGHVVAVVAVAVVGAGSAVEVQQSLGGALHHHRAHRPAAIVRSAPASAGATGARRLSLAGGRASASGTPQAKTKPSAPAVVAAPPAVDPAAAPPAQDAGPDTGGATLPPELASPPDTTTAPATQDPGGNASAGAKPSPAADGAQPAGDPAPASGSGDGQPADATAASAPAAPATSGAGTAAP